MEKKADFRSFRDGMGRKPYSPKVLPSKKSSVVSGTRRQLPRPGHLALHATSITWTQQSRLRELRIRCVARKFLYLWIRMTFGRVFPSKARFYHEHRMLQKVFGEWKEEWWISQREWKLCVRADCHYRYYLYNLMFQNWKIYVYQRQEMRSKYLKAENHDVKQKVQKAWKSWLIYVVVRRTKLQMHTTALEFRQRSILWVWWSKWRQRLRQAYVNHALHATAVKHRALSLQLQAWSRWQEELQHSQREKWKVVSAVRHHDHQQKQRALKTWLEYLHVRRMKRQQNEVAERFHHVTVLQIHFCDWQWAWHWRQSLSAHQALVEKLARKMALRRVFIHWKHYMLLRAEEAAQWEVADKHHQHRLLYFCFRALRDNVTRIHLQRIRRNLAHQQHDVTLQRRFWNLWQSRIEERKEREQLPLLHAAQGHYWVTLLRKCIRFWLWYVEKKRYKQLLKARADHHFQQRAMPIAFHTWSRLWRRHQQDYVLNARAVHFHRETLEKQVFALWWQKMSKHQENRLAERMAILQAERQLLRRSWSTWHRKAAAHHQEQERQAVARAHYQQGQLRKAFWVWRENARGLRTEMGRVRAAQFHSARLLHWAWSKWRKVYQGRVQRVLQEVAARESQHNRQLLRWVLHRWRENAVAHVDEAKKTLRAYVHYRRTLCSKVLARWQEVASMKIHYRQQEAVALREAQKVLERGCLRTWFGRWQVRRQQMVQLGRAALHHRRQLLRAGMMQWKVHHWQCARKRHLQWQGSCFLAQRLSRACFCRWRQQLVVRRQEQQSTARALWFWAVSLQAKAWAAWLGFVLERRRKKARLERAMQAYHQQLLQEGATRLLRFAASMKALRQQLQARQQMEAAHSLDRAVRRCAELWKQKVLGQDRESRPPAPSPSRRVTFQGPLAEHIAIGAGDATLEATRRRCAPQPHGATGVQALPDLNAARSTRKQPRRPHFLLEPVQGKWPLGCGTLGGPGPEKPQEQLPGAALPAGLSLTRPILSGAVSASEKLLPPPSSFLSHGVGTPARATAQPVTPGTKPKTPPFLAHGSDSHLLLPGDFAVPEPGHGPEAAGCEELEAELEEIQQQLQHYQTTKQNLWSCQRQAGSLRRWLELCQEEPGPEDLDAEQQVQRELEEVELQIQQLTEELQVQRQPIGACIARIRALRRALC
ncbi:protein SFI1 homolog isoform X2 [Perognathus longimembris pacificus]|uniref:protein SFI1 homolog isoform X2 n=1 Tax=Perognathus longimembris pacificus TaxID=214514 RepID=UPI0020195C66|nr:protein SFI1 homolog isoform X2 [Perognathus longimembris pacificus]